MNAKSPNLADLIDALVANAWRKDFSILRWREGAAQIVGSTTANKLDAKLKGSYLILFRIPASNAHKYSRPDSSSDPKKLSLDKMTDIYLVLKELGYGERLEPPKLDDRKSGWVSFFSAAIAIVNSNLPRPALAEEYQEPQRDKHSRRIIHRQEAIDRVIAELERVGAVAIVGMPGSGKSVLAEQIVEELKQRAQVVIFQPARPWLNSALSNNRNPTRENYIGLCALILAGLAKASTDSGISQLQRRQFDQSIGRFRRRLEESLSVPRLAERDRRSREALLKALAGTPVRWETFVGAVTNCCEEVRSHELLAELATLLRIGAPEAVVVIDDVWSFDAAQFVIGPLFQRQQSNTSSVGLRLLVTSQQTTSLSFLEAKSEYDLDFRDTQERQQNIAFGRSVVAAWAMHGGGDAFTADSNEPFDRFRTEQIEAKRQIKADVDLVILRVGANPLSLAILASAWRTTNHDPQFWADAIQSLEWTPLLTLTLNKREGSSLIEDRHKNVIATVRFAWSMLEHELKERYLDLVVAPKSEPINGELFKILWRNGPRGKQGPPPALTIQEFADWSLLKPTRIRGTEYVLHDLHLMMIEEELAARGGRSAADRHRDLLTATKVLDQLDHLLVTERSFVRGENGRMRFAPDFGERCDASQAESASRYLVRHMQRHLAAALSADDYHEALSSLLTTYGYLQSRLDHTADNSAEATDNGNVRFLLEAFESDPIEAAQELQVAVRLCSVPLSQDRHQLAAQILGRMPGGQSSRIDALRLAAAAGGTRPAFVPRAPFLAGSSPNLICLCRHQQLVDGAVWMADALGSSAILSWSDDGHVRLWNPRTGQPRPLAPMKHSAGVRGAIWISDVAGHCAILSWASDHTLYLWDAATGRKIHFGQIDNGCGLDGVQVAPGAKGGGPAILSWLDYTVVLFDLVSGGTRWSTTGNELVKGAIWIISSVGPAILVWGSEGSIRLLNAETGEQHPTADMRHDSQVWGVEWLPNAEGGPAILSWSHDKTVRLWDAITGHPRLDAPIRHAEPAWGARWIPDTFGGPSIVSWSTDGVRIWDGRSGQEKEFSPVDRAKVRGALWIDGAVDAPAILSWSFDGTFSLWDAMARALRPTDLMRHESSVNGAEWVERSNGRTAILSWSDYDVRLWDARSGKLQCAPIRHDGYIYGAAWIENVLGSEGILTWSSDGSVRISSATGYEHSSIRQHDAPIIDFEWIDSDLHGSNILSWAKDRTISISDGRSGRKVELSTMKHDDAVMGATWIGDAPGGAAILSWSEDGTVRLWDCLTGKQRPLKQMKHSDWVIGAAWIPEAPGGPSIISWSFDGTIRFWDPNSGIPKRPPLKHDTGVWGAAWIVEGPTGPAILSWGSGIQLWDVISGKRRPLASMNYGFLSHPEASWVSNACGHPAVLGWSRSRGGRVQLWHGYTGQELMRSETYDKGVRNAQWISSSPEGPAILITSEDGKIHIMDARTGRRRDTSVMAHHGDDRITASWIAETQKGPAVLSWDCEGAINVWDASTGRPWPISPMKHDDRVLGALWISNALTRQAVLSWSNDGTIRLWDAATGRVICGYFLESSITSLRVIPSSRASLSVAVGYANGVIGMFDLQSS